MASVPKSTFESWQQHWDGRKVWAQQNGVPFNDFKTAVQYDYKRMTNPEGYGSPMSDDEAFDALSALKSGHNPFTTPADTPPTILSNPLDAIRNNLQNIFTGLFHAPQQIAHDVNQAIHGHFGDIANLIPGYTDITSLFSSSGRQYLLQNPISDILDFMGSGKLADFAETGLRQAGAVGAADTLAMIPDHPLSMAIKASTIKLADNISIIGQLKEGVTSVMHGAGLTKEAQNEFIRPSAGVKAQVAKVPHPGLLKSIQDFTPTFGWEKPGKSVIEVQKELAEGLTEQDKADINDVVTTSTYRGQPMTIDQYLRSDSFTPIQKTAMLALEKGSRNLSMWEQLNGYTKQVFHKDTGEIGVVQAHGSSWDKWVASYNKAKEKNDFATQQLNNTIAAIHNATNALHEADAQLPEGFPKTSDVTPIPDALSQVADFYRINRDNLFDMMPTGTDRTVFDQRLDQLFGTNSDFSKLIHTIRGVESLSDSQKIFNLIKKIQTKMARLQLPASPIKTWIDNTLTEIRSNTVDLYNNQLNFQKLESKQRVASNTFNRLDRQYQLNWNKYTQSRFDRIVQDKMKQSVVDFIHHHYGQGEIHLPGRLKGIEVTPEMAEQIVQEAQRNYFSSEAMQLLIPPADWVEMENSAYMFIDQAKMNGANPLFVTAVTQEDINRINKGVSSAPADLSHYYKRSVQYERKPLLSDSIYNVWFAIPKESIDIYREALMDHVIKEFFLPHAITEKEIVARSFTEFSRKYKPEVLNDIPSIVKQWADDNNYAPWDPTDPIGARANTRFVASKTSTESRLWIPKNDLKLMKATFKEMDVELNKVYNVGMQAYRTGVLYASPRYAAHLGVGGSVMTLLQMSHPFIDTFKHFSGMIDIVRNPEKLPVFISRGVGEAGEKGELVANPFGSHNYLAGRKAGQLGLEANMARTGLSKVAAGLNFYKNALETLTLAQRALIYLSETARATEKDFTPEILEEARKWNMSPSQLVGARMANKALADNMILSPMERSVIQRYVMPFWGWTRHILRYVATFPMDHPLRASIINTLAQQAVGEGSNLPDYLFRLLFLGQPNAKGNVTVLDTRQWNPFRDVANYMTWGGIMSSLNPAIAAVAASAWGVDPSTGGPDLYPELTYDSFYGSSTATSGQNYFSALLQQVSPQISTLQQVMQKTSVMRSEAYSNPSKLPYLIADSLGLPWVPYQLNIPNLQIKQTLDEYSSASKAVSQAMVQNSLAPLQGYSGYLPYSGYEVNKGELGGLINQALASNKASGLDIPAVDQTALPYASPYAPEFLLSGAAPGPSDEQPANAQGGEQS